MNFLISYHIHPIVVNLPLIEILADTYCLILVIRLIQNKCFININHHLVIGVESQIVVTTVVETNASVTCHRVVVFVVWEKGTRQSIVESHVHTSTAFFVAIF
jgi:hypothetical protein